MFDGCDKLTTANFNNNFVTIDDYAFANSAIVNVSLFASGATDVNYFKTIGKYAFANCKNLTSLNIPNSTETIGEGALFGTTRLADLFIPFVGESLNATGSKALFGYIYSTNGLTNAPADTYPVRSYYSGYTPGMAATTNSYVSYIPDILSQNIEITPFNCSIVSKLNSVLIP
jgi:hypothetical protein